MKRILREALAIIEDEGLTIESEENGKKHHHLWVRTADGRRTRVALSRGKTLEPRALLNLRFRLRRFASGVST